MAEEAREQCRLVAALRREHENLFPVYDNSD